jgi:CNP1-like family
MAVLRVAGAALGLWLASSALAQVLDNPDWKESEAPPPPAFDLRKLLPLDVSANAGMQYGVDPASIQISKSDSLVRYVMVATSPGGVRNVMYEALRCGTGDVKVYARQMAPGQWQAVSDPQWRSVFDKTPSRHALAFARAGACDGRSPATSVNDIVSKLKTPGRYLDY